MAHLYDRVLGAFESIGFDWAGLRCPWRASRVLAGYGEKKVVVQSVPRFRFVIAS